MLRVSEIYPSIQGEGLNIGRPTLFVRFAGCNLKCPLWPCDTQHAIDPAIFSKDQIMMTPTQIIKAAIDEYHDVKNICLTGGEPMLQKNSDIFELADGLIRSGRTVEMFSNGTLPYDPWLVNNVTICMDYKLRGAGDNLVKYKQSRIDNILLLDHAARPQSVKFTIASEADYEDARQVASVTSVTGNISVYFGAVWGKVKESDLVNWMLNDGLQYKLNVQVHNYIWDRNKRGI